MKLNNLLKLASKFEKKLAAFDPLDVELETRREFRELSPQQYPAYSTRLPISEYLPRSGYHTFETDVESEDIEDPHHDFDLDLMRTIHTLDRYVNDILFAENQLEINEIISSVVTNEDKPFDVANKLLSLRKKLMEKYESEKLELTDSQKKCIKMALAEISLKLKNFKFKNLTPVLR